MAELVVLVLHDPDKLDEVLAAWLKLGALGITILDSRGLRQSSGRCALRDDLPLFPGLSDILEVGEEHTRTFFAIAPDGSLVDSLVATTESILGKLDLLETGILFTIPLTRVLGSGKPARP